MFKRTVRHLFLLFAVLPLSASVTIKAPEYFMQGEALEFEITARGFEIKIPEITAIDGCRVESVKSAKEAVLIDMRKADKITKTYRLFANKDITIPSFSVVIDGETERTQSQEVRAKAITKTVSKDFDLQMQLSKTSAFIGEELLLRITFAHIELEDYSFGPIEFSTLTLKELDEKQWRRADGLIVEQRRYAVLPQSEGTVSLHPLKVKAEVLKSGYKHLNNLSRYIQKHTIYSNALKLDVKALPKGLSLFGDYRLTARVDRKKVRAGQALVLTLDIQGTGEIDTLDGIDLNIPDATVYAKATQEDLNGSIRHYVKRFEIVSDQNFTIPAVRIDYFDKTHQTHKSTQSEAIDIEVLDTEQPGRDAEPNNTGLVEKIILFAMGVFSLLALMLIYKGVKSLIRRKRKPELLLMLQKTRTPEALFKKIVPYLGKDKGLDRLIYRLEGEEKPRFKAIKKEVIRHILLLSSQEKRKL